MIPRRFAWFFPPIVLLLLPFFAVQACGPGFMPDVFVRATHPDNPQDFAQGHLGILQPRFDSSDFAVAFRYLSGGTLSAKERAAYAPEPEPPLIDWAKMTPDQIAAAREAEAEANPSLQWKLAQARYTGESDPAAQQKIIQENLGYDATYYNPDYPNCPDAAFKTAVLTLNSRASTWGAQSPYLKNWLEAQGTVLSNCAGKNPAIPAAAPADSPALLRADRAYQIAAATFYAGKFADAQQQFEAIANDKTSPWHIWGDYLAARAEVRLAFSQGKPTNPWAGEAATFNMQTMQSAQQKLEALLQNHDPQLPRQVILDELNFVRVRTEPQKRLAEICAALAGPAPDPDFRQNLDDLNYFLYWKVSVPDPPPLYAWIAAIRHGGNTAYALWQQNHSQPWLVAAIMNAAPQDAGVPALLDAAAAVHPSSPAYDTAAFHRARLLIGLNRADEARALLDTILSHLNPPKGSSIRNAFLGERMQVARNFEELLAYAPRSLLQKESEGTYALNSCAAQQEKSGNHHCSREEQPSAFDEDSVAILNRQIPLSLLVRAATSPTLPSNLRQNVALAAWVRAVLLHDDAAAAKLAPQLPETIRKTAGSSTGFPAVLAILHNPGLRPNLEPGISRLSSYSYLENFRDNWWCPNGQQQYYAKPQKPATPKPLTFLSGEEQKEAESQYRQLATMPCAPTLLGQRVIDYAKTHPSDPDVPEALALTVRATHYGWMEWTNDKEADAQNSAVSKTAFQLLHARYPKSPWTARTPYHY